VIGAAAVLILRWSGRLQVGDVCFLRGTDQSGSYRYRRRQMPWHDRQW
jgi:hypothetical protein